MAQHIRRKEPKGLHPALNLPNALTTLRLVLVPVFLYLVIAGTYPTRWAALIVFCVAAYTDMLDGKIARAQGLETDFGRIADPIADKALTLGAFFVLSWGELIAWWFTLIVAVRELGITVLRAVLLRRGIVVPANSGGKLKTVLQMGFIFLLLIPWETLIPDGWIPALASVVYAIGGAALAATVWSGAVYVLECMKLWKQSNEDEAILAQAEQDEQVEAQAVEPVVVAEAIDSDELGDDVIDAGEAQPMTAAIEVLSDDEESIIVAKEVPSED